MGRDINKQTSRNTEMIIAMKHELGKIQEEYKNMVSEYKERLDRIEELMKWVMDDDCLTPIELSDKEGMDNKLLQNQE